MVVEGRQRPPRLGVNGGHEHLRAEAYAFADNSIADPPLPLLVGDLDLEILNGDVPELLVGQLKLELIAENIAKLPEDGETSFPNLHYE